MPEPPSSEYEAAREGAALLALPERGTLAATGPQRQKFLHGILSNAIEGLQPGQGCLAALLDVKGHLTALMRALVTPDAVLLEAPADRLARVKETLLFYKVGAPVRFEERPAALFALLGTRALDALLAAGASLDSLAAEAHAEVRLGDAPVRVCRASDLPAAGFVVHATPETAPAVEAALLAAGAAPIGRETLDLLRIEDGRPWFGPDLGEENLLHETGLLREYHSSSKGCYLGQEVIARLEARGGHVSRQVRGLRLSAATSAGATVGRDGKDVGRVTTAGVSPRFGPIALAVLHRSAFDPGTPVAVAGVPATVVAVPFLSSEPP